MNPESVTYFIPVKIVNGRWASDKVHLRSIFKQLRREARLSDSGPDPKNAYDLLLTVAGKHQLGLETTEV